MQKFIRVKENFINPDHIAQIISWNGGDNCRVFIAGAVENPLEFVGVDSQAFLLAINNMSVKAVNDFNDMLGYRLNTAQKYSNQQNWIRELGWRSAQSTEPHFKAHRRFMLENGFVISYVRNCLDVSRHLATAELVWAEYNQWVVNLLENYTDLLHDESDAAETEF